MEQELINIIEELRVTAHQIAHTYTREIAENDMDVDQWALLQEGLKQINLKSQEAFLMVASIRRNIRSKCDGNCGMNYCDENGCMERKRVLTDPCPPDAYHSA